MAKIGRNDPCPCGSGKKYKQCHGPIDAAHEAEQRNLRRAQDTLFGKVMEAAPAFAGEFARGLQLFWNGAYPVEAIDDLDEHEERGAERFLAWFMFDHEGRSGKTPVQQLADDPSTLDLSPAEARLLPMWTDVRLQPFLVTDVLKGQGLMVKPLWAETPMLLEDQAAAKRVEVGEVLIVHLTPAADIYLVAGAAAHLTADTVDRLHEWAELHLADLRVTAPEASYDTLLRERSYIFNHFVMALPREEQAANQRQALQNMIDMTRARMTATANIMLNRDVEEDARLVVPTTEDSTESSEAVNR